MCPWYISNWNSRWSFIKKHVKHWRILSYRLFTPSFLLILIALTVTNTFSVYLFDFRVGWFNLGSFGAALISRCSRHSGSLMRFSCSTSDSTSAAQLSSLLCWFLKSPFQLSQYLVSKMLSGAQYSSHSTGWRLNLLIQQTFNNWVLPTGRSFADKAGGKGDLSVNLNAAAPWCSKSDHDALTIYSVSKMYPAAVI